MTAPMKNKTALVALILFAVSAALYSYRVFVLGYPPLPAPQVKAWDIGFVLYVKPDRANAPLTVRAFVPRSGGDKAVVDERIISAPLSMAVSDGREGRTAAWTGLADSPEEHISYRATVVIRQRPAETKDNPVADPALSASPAPEIAEKLEAMAAPLKRLAPAARLPAALQTFKSQWPPSPAPVSGAGPHPESMAKGRSDTLALAAFLQLVGLPARPVEGLPLREGVTATTTRWVEVWTGKAWEAIDPGTAAAYPPEEELLALATGDAPLLTVTGGSPTEAQWSLGRQVVSPWRLHLEPILHQGGLLARWSLFSLPAEFQGTFRVLLLIPIGALMISILRNIVGFPTFGIFMPVLMALAFRATGVFYGIAIFAGVVFVGYAIRRSMNRLRLLLVPRLATLLTLVVFCFALLAVIGSKLGLRSMMAVGLLPFVILTMTVERFYVLIEESGVKQALLTAAGSAAVAILTYKVLEIERLQLLFFVFPELLFAVGACQMLLGRYTGYRLSEYIRFRALRKPS